MDLPDPEEFSIKGSFKTCALNEALKDEPELRRWLHAVLAARLELPSNRRVTLESIRGVLNENLGESLTEHALYYYNQRYFGGRRRRSVKPDVRGSSARDSEAANTFPPGWEAEHPATGVPAETAPEDPGSDVGSSG